MTSDSTTYHVQASLPIFALPAGIVLFPGITVRLPLAPSQTSSAIAHFNEQVKSIPSRPDIQALHKGLGIGSSSNGFSSENRNASLITVGVVPRIDPEATGEDAKFLSSKFDKVEPRDLLNDTGIVARVVRIERSLTAGRYQLVLEGFNRFTVDNYTTSSGEVTEANVTVHLEQYDKSTSQDAVWSKEQLSLLDTLKSSALKLIEVSDAASMSPNALVVRGDLLKRIVGIINATRTKKSASVLTDILAATLPIEFKDKITLLKSTELEERIQLTTDIVSQRLNMIQVSDKIKKTVEDKISKQQREFILRQQLNAIKEELGENDKNNKAISNGGNGNEEEDDLAELKQTLENAKLTPEGRKTVDRELKRLKRMHPTQAEYQVCRTYLEAIAEVPWGKFTDDNAQENPVQRARQILDADHYSLEKVKKRLLEYLAVLHLKQKRAAQQNSMALVKVGAEPESSERTHILSMDKSPILLLVGPPGVGKTSLAKSVARALGREFHRISLGGVRDEAEIRGHRRTYIGAMPGVLVQALRKVGTMNPVILLDEIDKVSKSNFHGDPSAALLEVLDPEQNSTFTDHYINFPVDLSHTLFIATANSLSEIPGPLLDRMETIQLEGYTYMEKKHIATSYLVPKQMNNNGLDPGQLEISDAAILKIVTQYTREAGVRNLEREIGAVCRGKAVEYAEVESAGRAEEYVSVVDAPDVEKYLGIETFTDDVVNDDVDVYVDSLGHEKRRHTYGVVNGLAYMGSGNGGILMFESTAMPGSGKIKYTGQLGSVISESAEIALSWVKANSFQLGLTKTRNDDIVNKLDIHLHAPAGSIPKDGPSAGMAMTITFISLLAKRPVPRDLAMTGEMTLRGKILPVGGIREKLLGAHMSGIRRVLLPFHCRKVVEEECGFLEELHDFEVIYVKYIWDALSQVWPSESYPLVLDGHL